jgi:hypothetical protein
MLAHLSKLTTTLRQLNTTEMEKLEAYLSSPYFETSPKALTLFQYLKKLHPDFEEKKMSPAVIEKKAHGLGNQKKQANYGSDLLKAIEHFLALEDFQSSADNLSRHRLQAYKKHHLFEQFSKEHQQQLEQLNKNEEQDIDVFYNRHILTELNLSGFDAKLNRNTNNDIHPITETLDAFYAIKKLCWHCEFLNRMRVLGTPYAEENVDYVLQTLDPYNNSKFPYVFVYINAYHLLHSKTFEEGEKYHLAIRNFVEQHTGSTLPQSIKETMQYTINHCQYWISKGYQNASSQALWWQELRIKHDILLEHGKILPADFRNIIGLAILARKEKEWIKNFIHSYSRVIPAEHVETNKAFAQAQYHYYIKEYDKAMPLFQKAQVKEEPIFNAIVRRWQFMCMYEADPGNIDLLSDFLSAYEKYILRYSDGLHQYKELFTKNIYYSKKLLKASDAKTRKDLKEQLTDDKYFTGKEWLLKCL